MKWGKTILISVLCLLSGVQMSYGHKVSIFAWVEGDTVYTESKFLGGKKPQNAVVEVYDEKGNKLLQGETDENGAFSFKAPVRAKLKVVLVAGMGHGNEWVINADEFEENADQEGDSVSNSSESSTPVMGGTPVENADRRNLNGSLVMTSEDLQAALEKVLDKKLHPLMAKLNQVAQKDDEPSVSEMLGALGYIIGLVGLGAYMNFRKKVAAR